MMIGKHVWGLLVGIAALLSVQALSREASAPVRIGNDLFFSAGTVRVAEEIAGDALLAGGEVVLDGTVGGDAAVAGGQVSVRGAIREDLYAAGGEVFVDADVSGSARLAGGEVEVADGARIADGLTIAGGEVELNGEAGSYVQIAAGSVRINGRVAGNVNVSGGELKVGPSAVIDGALTFTGPQAAEIASGAQIRDGVRNISRAADWGRWGAAFATFAIVWIAGWLLVGVILLAVFPGVTSRVTATVRSRPWQTILIGLALLIVVPITIVVLAVTLVGIPLALLLLLAYFLLLPLGYLAGVMSISDWLLPRLRAGKPISKTARILMFVAALLILVLIDAIPVIGVLIALLILLAGMGGVAMLVSRRTVETPS